jgi:hypothetical protein
MIGAHQPGSQPIDIPEVFPNPAVVPKQQPAPKEPVRVPEKVPADRLRDQKCARGVEHQLKTSRRSDPDARSRWPMMARSQQPPIEAEQGPRGTTTSHDRWRGAG